MKAINSINLFQFRVVCEKYILIILSIILILGCNPKKKNPSEDIKASKDIAFLIIESNYGLPENEEAIKEGIKYSRTWLLKQSPEKKEKLEELSYALLSLIINLNIEYLEEMTNKPENIKGKLNQHEKQRLENLMSEDEGFLTEWQEHKRELDKGMFEKINEFRKKIKAEKNKEQIILKTRDIYKQTQPVLRQLMEDRIKELFHT
ncbi:MAG: hypothetical protein JW864_07625 [Spirochaetes bacterium]|nr:hypothetical protein [Spirochaetota bacterium]